MRYRIAKRQLSRRVNAAKRKRGDDDRIDCLSPKSVDLLNRACQKLGAEIIHVELKRNGPIDVFAHGPHKRGDSVYDNRITKIYHYYFPDDHFGHVMENIHFYKDLDSWKYPKRKIDGKLKSHHKINKIKECKRIISQKRLSAGHPKWIS